MRAHHQLRSGPQPSKMLGTEGTDTTNLPLPLLQGLQPPLLQVLQATEVEMPQTEACTAP